MQGGPDGKSWLAERLEAVWNGLFEHLILTIVLAAAALALAVCGIRFAWFPVPAWVPFQPERPAVSSLKRNNMDGMPGYTFVSGVFDDARRSMDNQGGLIFAPPQIEMLRVCRDLEMPQTENAAELLEALRARVSPCLTITPQAVEGRGVRYTVRPRAGPELTTVSRANRGGTEPVPQYFCFCEPRVAEKFLSDGGGQKWP